MQLDGRIAVITGGTGGIGRAIAEAFLAEGARVVVSGRNADRGKQVVSELGVDRALFAQGDATTKEGVEQAVEAAVEHFGHIDIMVNNAGSAPGGVIEHLSEADWAQALGLKFMGYVRCLRYVLPIMLRQGGGRVVNLIGNDGVKPSYWEIAPGAANAAGQNLTRSLAGQYGRHNISFCAVNPGPVRTERWAGLVAAMSRDMKLPYAEADKLAPSSIPMGRIAEVEEVANLVVMLASPLMHMVNGTMIEIDGGQEKSLMDRLRDRPA